MQPIQQGRNFSAATWTEARGLSAAGLAQRFAVSSDWCWFWQSLALAEWQLEAPARHEITSNGIVLAVYMPFCLVIHSGFCVVTFVHHLYMPCRFHTPMCIISDITKFCSLVLMHSVTAVE